MSNDTRDTGGRLATEGFLRWWVGDPSALRILVQDGDAATELVTLLNSQVLHDAVEVFVPTGELKSEHEQMTLFEYQGNIADVGDDLFVVDDGGYIATQSYCSVPYLAIASPTVIDIADSSDYSAFLTDAQVALETGLFPEQLTHPAVHIAQSVPLAGDIFEARGSLLLDRNRMFRRGIHGHPMFGLNDPSIGARLLQAPHRDSSFFSNWSGSAPDQGWEPGGGIGRYLTALQLLKSKFEMTGEPTRISGFGHYLNTHDVGCLYPAIPGMHIGWRGAEHWIYLTDSNRMFGVGRHAAIAAEALVMSGGSTDDAATRFAETTGHKFDAAKAAVDSVAPFLAEHGMAMAKTGTATQ